jgi:phosphoglycerol transferase MdoB-like AlkP superfamily enzyme
MIDESDDRVGTIGTGVVLALIGLGIMIAAALAHPPKGESNADRWCQALAGVVFLLFGLAMISREGSKFRAVVILTLLGVFFAGFGWVSIFSGFKSSEGILIRVFAGIMALVALVGFLSVAWKLFRGQPLSGWATYYSRRY